MYQGITIYGRKYCRYTELAMKLVSEVDNLNCEYIEVKYDKDNLICNMSKKHKTSQDDTDKIRDKVYTQIPRIFVNDVFIGGYVDLVDYLKK